MAGITDFTAISHGVNNMMMLHENLVNCAETYISMTYVIIKMTYVMAGGQMTDLGCDFLLSPQAMKDARLWHTPNFKKRGEKAMEKEVGGNQIAAKFGGAESLAKALQEATTRCRDCKTSSPMVCVERCDIWQVKNEILSVRQKAGEKGHIQLLLNTVKNPRRLKILDALCDQSHSLTELQKYLKQFGFYHSRSTIMRAYIKPLISTGLVQENGSSRFRVTFYGRKVRDLFHTVGREAYLPIHSCCYEEIIVKELMKKPRTFDELIDDVPRKSLARILTRLRSRGLLKQGLHRDYVFYSKIKEQPRVPLSPTEKRIFDTIPLDGISAHQLRKQAKITLRRTYKYLRRLRQKKLVFALKKPRTYTLTRQGREVAALLDEMDRISNASVNVSAPSLPR